MTSDDDMMGLGMALRMPSDEPDTIGPETARRILPYFGTEKPELTLLELQAIPDTLIVGADLDAVRMELAALAGQTGQARRFRQVQGRLVEQERRYRNAIVRDGIQTTRPPDCWCLGYGGKEPRYLPMLTGQTFIGHDQQERPETEPYEILQRHCDHCAEGIARTLSDHAARTSYWEDRDRRAVARRFGQAHLPPEYRWHPWRDHPDQKAVARVLTWKDADLQHEDLTAKWWLLLYGEGGRGKTTLAAGMAAELVETGASVLFRTMPDLLNDIKATWGKEDGEADILRDLLCRVRWLFVDDIGAEVPRDWVGEFFYAIVNHRHNYHMRTVFTSNLGTRETGLRDLAVHLGERIWGRFKRMAEPVAMDGPDLRDAA